MIQISIIKLAMMTVHIVPIGELFQTGNVFKSLNNKV